MNDFPQGTIMIEIFGIYDGWSVAKLPDGTLVNRWEPGDYRHERTEQWIRRAVERRALDGDSQ